MLVLVVEDDPLVARSLVRMLRMLGCEATPTVSISEAIAAMRAMKFDAIVADLGLQNGESGRTALDWARTHLPTAKRILVSGMACPPDFVDHPPMDIFLRKPFLDGSLDKAIRE